MHHQATFKLWNLDGQCFRCGGKVGQPLVDGVRVQRGLNFLVYDGENWRAQSFDTYFLDTTDLISQFLWTIPINSIIMVAACDEASRRIGDKVRSLIQSHRFGYREPFAAISVGNSLSFIFLSALYVY